MRDTPDLGTIQAFIAVAESGSFAQAVRSTGLTRSALGKALVRLETRLGTRLLHRTTRQVNLTPEGAEYLQRTRQILHDLSEAEAAVRQDRPVPRGILKLSLPDAYGRLRVLPVLKRFLQEYQDVSAEISFTDRPVHLIEEGLDLAVRIGNPPTNADFVGRVVARSSILLCAAPVYLEQRQYPEVPDDLANHDRLHFGNGRVTMGWNVPRMVGKPLSIAGSGRVTLDSAEAIRAMAVAGFGIAQLPRFLVAEDLVAGRLVAILTTHPQSTVSISVVYPNRGHLPARVRLFIDRLSGELEDD